jgi:hypothetical protein
VHHLHWHGSSKEGGRFPAELKIGGAFLYSSKSHTVYPGELTAIVDTGADGLVIPKSVADVWAISGILPDGKLPAENFHGDLDEYPYYFVDLFIPGVLEVRMEMAITRNADHILIGRSILDKADMLLVVDATHRRWSLGQATPELLSACENSGILQKLSAFRKIVRWLG